jgi:hypothetical protein
MQGYWLTIVFTSPFRTAIRLERFLKRSPPPSQIRNSKELAKRKDKGEDIFGEKRRKLETELEKADQKIDHLVYQHRITDKEREIIEASL